MDKTIKETAQLHFKKMVLSYAEMCGSDKKAIDLFQVSKTTYYHWKKKYKKGGYCTSSKKLDIIVWSNLQKNY